MAKALPPPQPVLPKPKATHLFDVDPGSDIVGYVQKTIVGKDDTLPDIARRFDVGYEEILTANPGVDPWLPGVGREVVVPTQFILPAAPHEGVVVNVAAMRIFYYPPHKKGEPETVYTHPIGIGKVGWKTPEGTTKIVSRQKDPVWVVPKSVREEHQEDGEQLPAQVPAGPDNPLGAVRVPLGLAELPDPRHQQALRRRHALQPRLHAPVSGGHRRVFRSDSHRHQGDRGQSALSCSDGATARCICRPTPSWKTIRAIGPRTASACSQSCCTPSSARRSPSMTTKSIGSASATWRTRRAPCRCRSPAVRTASMT